MKTKYVTQKDFDNLPTIESFPNPKVKISKIGNEKIRLSVACTIELEYYENGSNWHKIPPNTWVGRAGDRFFPTDLIAGVVNGLYSENTPLSIHTGYVSTVNLGTAGNAFKNKDVVIEILRENNFEVVEKKL